MTAAPDARGGEVPPPSPSRGPADQALNAVLTAETSVEQLRAYAALRDHLTDHRAAIQDDVCKRVTPVGAWFSRCMRARQGPPHTVNNQRWATAADQPYPQYPTVDTCWKEET